MLIMVGVPVEADFLQLVVGVIQNGSAGSFINAAALHAYQPVFHHIAMPMPLAPPSSLSFFTMETPSIFSPFDGGWNALFKVQVT